MQYILSAAPLLVVLFGIYLTSFYSYLLFHGLAESFSIIVACGIFMIAWNTRRYLQNHYLLFIGIGYLYVGGLDLLHTLAFEGMGVFEGYGANLPTQLWVVARYAEALSLLIAPLFLRRKLRPLLIFPTYGLATGLLLLSIFYWEIFPDCFVEGVGLTSFKIYSEYLICLILLASIGLLLENSKEFERRVLILLIGSILVAVVSELAFTAYLSTYGPMNLIGHLLKIVSFSLIYIAIIETGLVSPHDLLYRSLKQGEERFRFLFEEAPIPYQSLDEEGRILIVNATWLETLGYAREEAIGKWFGDFLTPQARGAFKAEFLAFKKAGKVRGLEFEMVRKDGSRILASFNGRIGRDPEGRFRQTHCTFSDITESRQMEEELRRARDELELRVEERTSDLQRVNAELEAKTARLELLNGELQEFAFVASHDLQEPLRKIQSFSTRLRSKYETMLGEEGCDFLSRMEGAANRMSSLLSALLDYSRVTTRAKPFTQLELTCIAEDAVSDLEIAMEHAGASVEVGSMPIIEADPDHIRQLFQNLIGNALKYRKQDARPDIRVHGHLENGVCKIFVEDNGLGFDEKYLDKIFKPFQRLYGRTSVYEGIGMGLAIARKIVERHGGSITAKSTPGKGSTFIVTLPIRQSTEQQRP